MMRIWLHRFLDKDKVSDADTEWSRDRTKSLMAVPGVAV
jgi:hypothetical protein